MQWVQWKGNQMVGKTHATCTGHKTLCNRVIPDNLIYNKPTPPKDRKDVCLPCQKAEAEIKRFEHLLR